MTSDAPHANMVPEIRIQAVNTVAVRSQGDYVLYWMNAFRRAEWNYSLDRAVEWAARLRRPLLVVESLPSGRRWDSDRRHRFVLEGMAEHARRFDRPGVAYYPLVETVAGTLVPAMVALASRACVMVTDDFPLREHLRDIEAVAGELPLRVEKVDSNGLLPLRAADRTFTAAHWFRRFLQTNLAAHLAAPPKAKPLAHVRLPEVAAPKAALRRWPPASAKLLAADAAALASLPIDHAVPPAAIRGGPQAAARAWRDFFGRHLAQYDQARNHPDHDATSGLSPYLHFGHISVHHILADLAKAEEWTSARLGRGAQGWGMDESAEAFVDELVTWRELGFNMSARRDDYDQYDSLPQWAQRTLAQHAGDPRQPCYSLTEFEQARTDDPLWNAAQTQLVREGRLHNYLRMLWGKKILEWTADPREAAEVMIHLNNQFALDGCDPNSYSGIFWVLGRYDRAWGERPIFGTIRFMSSANTARKVRVKQYIARYDAR